MFKYLLFYKAQQEESSEISVMITTHSNEPQVIRHTVCPVLNIVLINTEYTQCFNFLMEGWCYG